jgi:hypothetical protein
MSLKVKGLLFSGPYELTATTVRHNHSPVVYIVVEKGGEAWDPKYTAIYAGETAGKTVVFKDHPELNNWLNAAKGAVSLYFYTPEPGSPDVAAQRQSVVSMLNAELPVAINH